MLKKIFLGIRDRRSRIPKKISGLHQYDILLFFFGIDSGFHWDCLNVLIRIEKSETSQDANAVH